METRLTLSAFITTILASALVFLRGGLVTSPGLVSCGWDTRRNAGVSLIVVPPLILHGTLSDKAITYTHYAFFLKPKHGKVEIHMVLEDADRGRW